MVGDFMHEFNFKFNDTKLLDKTAVQDIVWRQPLFDAIKDDISEPDALNKVLIYEDVTFNMLSPGA